MIRFLTAILICVSAVSGDTAFQFYGETITVTVDSMENVEVVGDYYFKNNSAEKICRRLFYPVPLDSIQQCPDSFTVIQKNSKKRVPAETKDGIFFNVQIEPHSICTTRVVYNQKVEHSEFRYILLTTLTWSNSLNNSHYFVNLSDKFKLKWLSYPSDSVSHKDSFFTFSFVKDNFTPERDLIIKWE